MKPISDTAIKQMPMITKDRGATKRPERNMTTPTAHANAPSRPAVFANPELSLMQIKIAEHCPHLNAGRADLATPLHSYIHTYSFA